MSAPKPNIKRPIQIAGAGPAGLTAAILLQKNGWDVEVHEAKPKVGARWKRGFQIIENFSESRDVMDFLSELGIRANFETQPIHEVTLWDGKKKKAHFNSPQPLGYYVQRGARPGELDHGLLEQARECGVQVFFNSKKTSREVQIHATGPRRVDGMGKEVTFKTHLSDRMVVILDPALAPGGYSYLFIHDGEATLGMAILQNYRQADMYFEKTVKRFQEIEDLDFSGGEEAYLYANFFLKPSLENDGSLFAGEAGGFQDYLFGFGIRYAIQSGALAAQSISENVSYDSLWKAHLGKKQKISLWNRFFYEKCQNWLPRFFIHMAERSSDFRSYMQSWYQAKPLKLWTADVIQKMWTQRKLTLNLHDDEAAAQDHPDLTDMPSEKPQASTLQASS